ncbi:MAG: hypothetical protein J4G09_12970 [Proteobacteria bacterium]|nr:hypothetical protein [Pseudomonadota bacterium]
MLSNWAEEAGPLRALGLVRRGRDLLERSLEIDPEALGGAAHTTLGAIYYQVPGFPLGFGSQSKAEEHLRRALEIAPDAIDPNFFYGDYLMNRGRWGKAAAWLRRANAAPERPDRSLADAARRREVRQKLDLVRAELDKRFR